MSFCYKTSHSCPVRGNTSRPAALTLGAIVSIKSQKSPTFQKPSQYTKASKQASKQAKKGPLFIVLLGELKQESRTEPCSSLPGNVLGS